MPSFSSFLLFESDTEVKEPLMLDKVENIQILTPGVDPQGKYRDFFYYYSNLKYICWNGKSFMKNSLLN